MVAEGKWRKKMVLHFDRRVIESSSKLHNVYISKLLCYYLLFLLDANEGGGGGKVAFGISILPLQTEGSELSNTGRQGIYAGAHTAESLNESL